MSVIKRAVLTEKASALQEDEKKRVYTFVVDQDANKIQIKKAVQERYGVNVETVNTMRYAGKSKTRYTKRGVSKGRTASFKKAMVKLQEGEFIDLYTNVEE